MNVAPLGGVTVTRVAEARPVPVNVSDAGFVGSSSVCPSTVKLVARKAPSMVDKVFLFIIDLRVPGLGDRPRQT